MKVPKYRSSRALLHRMIAKQQAKKEQTHPVCLHAVGQEHYQMITKQQVKMNR